MAYQRYQGYQYETSPRKLEPEYEPRKNPYQKKKSSTQKANKTQSKNYAKKQIEIKAKVVIYLAIGFAILFAISYRNSLITESFNKKEELKQQLSLMNKENQQLKINIENSLNLYNVEQSAKEMLGMQKLDNSQKVYINLPKRDYIEPAMEDVVKIEKENIFTKVLNQVKNIIK